MSEDKKIDVEDFKQRLEGRKSELMAVAGVGGDAAAPVELDQSRVGRLSRIDALQNQAMSQEGNRRREVEMRKIASALARIADDEYGFCIECGQQIPVGRLQADPSAAMCVQCASIQEKL